MKNAFAEKIGLFLGVGILCAGLSKGYIHQQFVWLDYFLVLCGVLLCSIIFIKNRCRKSSGMQTSFIKERLKLAFLILFISVIFVGLNYLGARYDVRWDLTKNKQHTLLDETKAFLSEIQEHIQMTVFYVGIPPKYLEDILRQYREQSAGNIETEMIDPLVDIGYAARFGQVISGQEKKVIVQAGSERKDVDFSNGPLTEEAVNNALMQVTREARTVCFLTGHDEHRLFETKETGLNLFSQHLLANNMIAREIFLGSQADVPDDCRILVIAGPKQHLLDREIEGIQAYLQKGGDALFLIEHTFVTTPEAPLTEDQEELNPSLNTLLAPWGLEIAKDIVVDLASHASGDVGSPATKNYMAHKAIVGALDYTFFVRPRSIRMLPEKKKGVRLAPLVLTSSKSTSWGETDRYLDVKFNSEEDRPGPVPIAFVGWQPQEEAPDKVSDTRFVVVTDADFLSNAFVNSYSNAQFGLNILNWLSEKDYQTFLSAKDVEVVRLNLTSQQKRVIVVFLAAMLVMILTVGWCVWIERD